MTDHYFECCNSVPTVFVYDIVMYSAVCRYIGDEELIWISQSYRLSCTDRKNILIFLYNSAMHRANELNYVNVRLVGIIHMIIVAVLTIVICRYIIRMYIRTY